MKTVGSLFCLVVFAAVAWGQSCERCRVSFSCPVVVSSVSGPGRESTTDDWFSMIAGGDQESRVALVNFAGAACRIRRGNVCGSGSFCGRGTAGDFVLTNAHVAGTTIGATVRVQLRRGDGNVVDLPGRVIMAAYSSRTRTDWAVVVVAADSFTVAARPLSKTPAASGVAIGFWGCPGCVPPSGVVLSSYEDSGNTAAWTPNSIGGQSGSSLLRLDSGVAVCLLTWTSNGRGLGQTTAGIWRQASEQNTDGQARDGSEFVRSSVDDLHDGFFAETGIGDLPIWETDDVPPPGGGGATDPDCERLLKLREMLRARGAGTRWAEVLRLILLLIEELTRD